MQRVRSGIRSPKLTLEALSTPPFLSATREETLIHRKSVFPKDQEIAVAKKFLQEGIPIYYERDLFTTDDGHGIRYDFTLDRSVQIGGREVKVEEKQRATKKWLQKNRSIRERYGPLAPHVILITSSPHETIMIDGEERFVAEFVDEHWAGVTSRAAILEHIRDLLRRADPNPNTLELPFRELARAAS